MTRPACHISMLASFTHKFTVHDSQWKLRDELLHNDAGIFPDTGEQLLPPPYTHTIWSVLTPLCKHVKSNTALSLHAAL